MNTKILLLLLPILLLGASAIRPADFYKYIAETEFLSLGVQDTLNFTQKNFTFDSQLLDHFNPEDNTTFKQRYWTVDQYWDPQEGPVILYICGEYECPGLPQERLYPLVLAQKYNALIIILEHRFYGASQPFTDLSTAHLRYLTVDQALDDLAYFINWAKTGPVLNLGTERRWMTYGGSYPGALSAWFRYKYPHLTSGAVASSAVINSIIDYQDYDHQLYLSALKSGRSCVDRIQEINKYVEDKIYGAGADPAAFKATFKADNLTNDEFINFFGDSFAGAIQYGNRTGLCQLVVSDSFDDRYAQVKNFVMTTNDPSGYMISTVKNDSYYPGRDAGRQWTWQVCSELGWFQTAYKNASEAFRSQRLDVNYSLNYCKQIFGDNVQPDSGLANMKRGGLQLDVSNLIMVNGIEDPWKWASRTWSYDQVTSYVVDCDNCAHCVEMYTPSEKDSWNLYWTRVKITNTVGKWFGKNSLVSNIQAMIA